MEAQIENTKIILIIGDITEQETDAIVNAANPSILGGGGVDGVIHRKGGSKILEECKLIRKSLPDGLPTGEAVVTSGGRLKARYVIHTVGPIWHGGDKGEPELLAKSYHNSLALGLKRDLKRISFPSISTGAYGYPIEKASRIALKSVIGFLEKNKGIDEVQFVLHSTNDLCVYKEALRETSTKGVKCPVDV